MPEDRLPELAARVDEPPGLSTVANLLVAALAQCCAQNQIAGSIVANVADVKHLIRWHLDGRGDANLPRCSRAGVPKSAAHSYSMCSKATWPSGSPIRERGVIAPS